MCDVTDDKAEIPIPDQSLDIIILIFVLSAISPEKWVVMCELKDIMAPTLYIHWIFQRFLWIHKNFNVQQLEVLNVMSFFRMQYVLNRLAQLLKPGGKILFRDYGRYDLAQLRFKTGTN